MPGLTLAAINPDNTPHGYNLTYAFPLVLFAVITLVLYLLFSRPHRRVPRRPISLMISSAAGRSSGAARSSRPAGSPGATASGATASGATASGGTAEQRPPHVGQGWQTRSTDGDAGADTHGDTDGDEDTPEAPE